MSPSQQNIVPTSTPDRILEEFRPVSANLDVPPSEVDPGEWTDILNFYMRQGFAQRSSGETQIFGDFLDPPVNLKNVVEGTSNFWVVMGNSSIVAIDQAGTVSDITPALYAGPITPRLANQTVLNGFPIQNFRQDPPTFWDKQIANPCAPLPGWQTGDIVRSIRAFKFFLFGLNLTRGGVETPDALIWSSAAPQGGIPTEWLPATTNQAGSTELSATSGGIVDGLALRGQFMIYKNHSTYSCNFTGGTFVFSFRKFLTTSGILANNCVAEVEGQHVVMTDGDVLLHDGQNVRSLVDRKMRRFIFLQIDPVNFQNSFVLNYRAAKECWICFPTQGNEFANLAVVWDYAHNLLSVRELVDHWSHAESGTVLETTAALDWDSQTDDWNSSSGSWNRAQFTGAFERALAAVPDSTIDAKARLLFIDNANSLVDGTPVGGSITRESLDLGAPESFKYIRRVWPRITGSTGTVVQVRVGVQNDPSSGILWSALQDFNVNVDKFLNFDTSGRYISVRFEEDTSPTAIPQATWSVHGFDLEYTLQGEFADE